MNEMTLSGLLRAGDSDWARNGADYLIVWVEGVTPQPEMILNGPENFESKLAYYKNAYNEDLTLKNNPAIKITNYNFASKADLFDYYL
jgi:hypothetical protein